MGRKRTLKVGGRFPIRGVALLAWVALWNFLVFLDRLNEIRVGVVGPFELGGVVVTVMVLLTLGRLTWVRRLILRPGFSVAALDPWRWFVAGLMIVVTGLCMAYPWN